MEHVVLFKERAPGPPVLPPEIGNARAMLAAMRVAIATCTAEEWSGPDDGSLSGLLECSDMVEISIHQETGGLHLDVCILHDPDVPDRGGMVGTVVDRRRGINGFMGLDAKNALDLARQTVDGWISEMSISEQMTSDAGSRLRDCSIRAATLFAAASQSTGRVTGEFLVRVEHSSPYGRGWSCGTDGPDSEWTLDEKTTAAIDALLPKASFYKVESSNPMILIVDALAWMPEWHGPDDAVSIMRVLAEHGVAHEVTFEQVSK